MIKFKQNNIIKINYKLIIKKKSCKIYFKKIIKIKKIKIYHHKLKLQI